MLLKRPNPRAFPRICFVGANKGKSVYVRSESKQSGRKAEIGFADGRSSKRFDRTDEAFDRKSLENFGKRDEFDRAIKRIGIVGMTAAGVGYRKPSAGAGNAIFIKHTGKVHGVYADSTGMEVVAAIAKEPNRIQRRKG